MPLSHFNRPRRISRLKGLCRPRLHQAESTLIELAIRPRNIMYKVLLIERFRAAANGFATPLPPLPLTVYPRIVVDMGKQEQQEVLTTFETELQRLGELL